MKTTMIRLISFAFPAIVIAFATANAQDGRLQIAPLDKIFPKAVQNIDVKLDGQTLLMAAKFLKNDKSDEAAVKDIIKSLKGVYVKGVEFDKEGEYADSDLDVIRHQLAAPGWDRIVGVRSKHEGQNVEVFLMINKESVIVGVGVLLVDPKKVMVVNIVGPLDPEKINNLRGQFGIPKDFSLDFSGVKSAKTDK